MQSIGINLPGQGPQEQTIINNAEVAQREAEARASGVSPLQAQRLAQGRAAGAGLIQQMQGRVRLGQMVQAAREERERSTPPDPFAPVALAGLMAVPT